MRTAASQQEHRVSLCRPAGDHSSLCERTSWAYIGPWPKIWTAHTCMMDGWMDRSAPLWSACMQNPSYKPTHDGSLYTYLAKGRAGPSCQASPTAAPRPAPGLLLLINPTSSRLSTHPSIARISCTSWPWLIPGPNEMVQANKVLHPLSVWLHAYALSLQIR